MPSKQLSLWGNEGIFMSGDLGGATSQYPFYLNGYFEKTGNADTLSRNTAYVKRPGLALNIITGFTAGHSIQGMISSIDRSRLFLYTNTGAANRTWSWDGAILTDRGVAPAAAGNWTNSGAVVFTLLDGISYGAGAYYCVTDFTKGAYVSNVGVWTEITDADFTGLAKSTNFAALDGYIFMGTTNNRIYNCDLNNVASWGATSFLTAADTPGNLVWLSKIRNYLVAFKDRSIEFFENVGNPTPGSPLEPRKQLNRKIGCINKTSIQEVSDGIIFAGAGDNQAPKLYKIDKLSLQIKEISSRFVERCLINGFNASYQPDVTTAGAPTQINGGQSQVFQVGAKEFYMIQLSDANLSTGRRWAHVYDNDLSIWTVWNTSFVSSGANDVAGFYGTQACVLNATTNAAAVFADNLGAATGARVMAMSPDLNKYDDLPVAGGHSNYVFGWVSDIYDFGSRKRKFMDALEIYYDMQSDVTPDPAASTYTFTLKYRDYDYNIATGFLVTRTIPADAGSGVRAIARRLGSFRRRNFAVSFTANAPMRLWAIEVQFNEGETEQTA